MSNIKIIDSNLTNSPDSPTSDVFRQAIGNTKTNIDGSLVSNGDLNQNITSYQIIDNAADSEDSDFYSQRQTIRIVGNEGLVQSQTSWRNFLTSIVPKQSFLDHTFNFNAPSLDESTEPLMSSLRTEMKEHSSFFHYENISKQVSSKVLPNYSLLQQYKYNEQSSQQIQDLLSFDGALSIGAPSSMLLYQNYYNNYVEDSANVIGNSNTVANKNTNIFLLDDDYLLSDEDQVPNCLFIESQIKESDFDLNISKAISDLAKRKNLFSFIHNTTPVIANFTDNAGNILDIPVRDLLSWSQTSGQTIFEESDDELFLLPEAERGSDSIMDNLLRSSMLYGWLLSNSKTKLRNLEDLLDYAPCYRETIGFKVEKYLNAEVSDALEQTYYYYGKTLRLIDSQIKYDQKYVYKISAITVVLGTEYRYINLKHSSADGFVNATSRQPTTPESPDTLDYLFAAELTVVSTPSIKIVEIPLRSSEEVYVNTPPNIPEVKFSNDGGKINELKIMVSNNFLDVEEEYVSFSNQDIEMLNKYRLAQGVEGNKIKTSHTSNSGKFAIYRMDQKPESMDQFANNFLVNIRTNIDYLVIDDGSRYKNPSYSKSAQFKDFILPNKKYYYLFRALDFHGNSGPSSIIYQVELMESSDDTYIEVKEYTFEQQKNYQYQIPMRRFMQIDPNPLQVAVNQDSLKQQAQASAYNYSSPLELGIMDKSLFGRKFKIRVTSKHTGKKVDINVVFTKKME